jgi:phytol kinase
MLGVLYGFAFIFIVLNVASLLQRKKLLGDEGARKFIHIGVSNWIIIPVVFIDNVYLALIAPVLFIIINFLSYKYNLIPAMERDQKSTNDLGTVYYAISLTIIVYLMYALDLKTEGIFAIAVMGWGDGLAAVFGKQFGAKKIFEKYNSKTYIGSFTMGFMTLLLGLGFMNSLPLILLVVLTAIIVEYLTPKGFDNLTVPLLIFLLLGVIA